MSTWRTTARRRCAAASRTRYDLVLMDLHMPVMDGYQATQQLRQEEPQRGTHTPIVALTADALAGDRERCLEAGMDDFTSPSRSAARMLAAVLERWTGRRTPPLTQLVIALRQPSRCRDAARPSASPRPGPACRVRCGARRRATRRCSAARRRPTNGAARAGPPAALAWPVRAEDASRDPAGPAAPPRATTTAPCAPMRRRSCPAFNSRVNRACTSPTAAAAAQSAPRGATDGLRYKHLDDL